MPDNHLQKINMIRQLYTDLYEEIKGLLDMPRWQALAICPIYKFLTIQLVRQEEEKISTSNLTNIYILYIYTVLYMYIYKHIILSAYISYFRYLLKSDGE